MAAARGPGRRHRPPRATATCRRRRVPHLLASRTCSPTPATCAASCRAPRRPQRPAGRRHGQARRAACCATPQPGPTDPVHQIAPGAVPRAGLRLDRRYVLGRRTDGQPVLWVQRRRSPCSRHPCRPALRRPRGDPRDERVVTTSSRGVRGFEVARLATRHPHRPERHHGDDPVLLRRRHLLGSSLERKQAPALSGSGSVTTPLLSQRGGLGAAGGRAESLAQRWLSSSAIAIVLIHVAAAGARRAGVSDDLQQTVATDGGCRVKAPESPPSRTVGLKRQ